MPAQYATIGQVEKIATAICKKGGQGGSGAENLAPAFDSSKSYEVGEVCTKDDKLFRCTTATSGEFNPSCWAQTTVVELINLAITGSINKEY